MVRWRAFLREASSFRNGKQVTKPVELSPDSMCLRVDGVDDPRRSANRLSIRSGVKSSSARMQGAWVSQSSVVDFLLFSAEENRKNGDTFIKHPLGSTLIHRRVRCRSLRTLDAPSVHDAVSRVPGERSPPFIGALDPVALRLANSWMTLSKEPVRAISSLKVVR